MTVSTISVVPNEYGTLDVLVALTDTEGNALTIDDLTTPQWQLMKSLNGSVINSRSFANCPLTALQWALTGADLQWPGKNRIAIKAAYTGSIGGGSPQTLYITAEAEFEVQDLLSQPIT